MVVRKKSAFFTKTIAVSVAVVVSSLWVGHVKAGGDDGVLIPTKPLKQVIIKPKEEEEAPDVYRKDGFFLRPDVQVFFIDGEYGRTPEEVGVGGGIAFTTGYVYRNFQFELGVGFQYYGKKAFSLQYGTPALIPFNAARRAQIDPTDPAFGRTVDFLAGGGAFLDTQIDSTEYFIPITLGFGYVWHLTDGGGFSITPSVAGGLWLHSVDRKFQYLPGDPRRWVVNILNEVLGGVAVRPTREQEFLVSGVVVPGLSFDFNPTDDISIRLASKFYLVPSGYSDDYGAERRQFVEDTNQGAFFTPASDRRNQFFWYGGINLSVEYIF